MDDTENVPISKGIRTERLSYSAWKRKEKNVSLGSAEHRDIAT